MPEIVYTNEQNYMDIADAIRSKNGEGNLLDISTVPDENLYVKNADGKLAAPSSTHYRHSDFIKIDGNTDYYFGITQLTTTSVGIAWYSAVSESAFISGKAWNTIGASKTAKSPATAEYLRFCWRIDAGYDVNWETTVYVCRGTTGDMPTYKPSEMAPAIMAISPAFSGTINITENGLYSVGGYENANVSIHHPYLDKYEGDMTTFTDSSASMVRYGAFAYTPNLSTVNFSSVETISTYAFANCYKLSYVSFPNCKTIGGYAFQYCSSLLFNTTNPGVLDSTAFPSLSSTLGTYAFRNCSKLKEIDLSNVTSTGTGTFLTCVSLISVNMPALTNTGSGCFSGCSRARDYSLSALKIVSTYAFGMNYSLSTITLSAATNIYANAFRACSKLESLYLPGSTQVALSSTTAFASSPMSVSTLISKFGSIYVPSSMVDAYKAATNWATYKNRITAIT